MSVLHVDNVCVTCAACYNPPTPDYFGMLLFILEAVLKCMVIIFYQVLRVSPDMLLAPLSVYSLLIGCFVCLVLKYQEIVSSRDL